MSRFAKCCGKYERGQRCGACPLDDALVDTLGGNPELREEILTRLTALRAALAAATAREAKPLPAGLATVEALLDYIQSAGVEQPDPIRQRLHAALAAHTECVVRWCMDNPRTTFEVDGQTYNESWRSYLARALAAAKGGQND